MKEKSSPYPLFEKMVEFGDRPGSRVLSNFVIEDEIRDSKRVPLVVVGLFPDPLQPNKLNAAMVTADPRMNQEPIHYWSKIKDMTLPDRVKDLNIPDIDLIRSLITLLSLENEWPIVMLSINKYQDSGKEFTLLQCIAGISPQTALSLLQDKAQERLAEI